MKRAARWEWALLIALLVSFAWGTWADRTQQQLSDKVLRLHVLANSDSGEDQALKLKVRDAVLEQATETLRGADSQAEASRRLTDILPELEETARVIITANGYDYGVRAELAEYAGELPGVEVQVVDSRKYPTTLATHVLGRIGSIDRDEYEALKEEGYGLNDVLGKNGMEKALEAYLRGEDGTRAVEVDRRTGQVVTEYMVEETQPGSDCYLTIRSDLQQRAETALAETLASIKEKGAQSKNKDGADVEGGAVVVIRVNTGEVLAMASWPTYSLATFQADYSQNATDPLRPFWNRAAQGTYSPGSTFKMATALASLEEGIITPRTKITDKGRYERYSDYQPKCWIYRQHGRTHGTINVSEALKYSCNYFFYEMGYQLGIERLERYASQLGLGQRTGPVPPGSRRCALVSRRCAYGGHRTGGSSVFAPAAGKLCGHAGQRRHPLPAPSAEKDHGLHQHRNAAGGSAHGSEHGGDLRRLAGGHQAGNEGRRYRRRHRQLLFPGFPHQRRRQDRLRADGEP